MCLADGAVDQRGERRFKDLHDLVEAKLFEWDAVVMLRACRVLDGPERPSPPAASHMQLNPVLSHLLAQLKVISQKRVPRELLSESEEVRMHLLAGILDGAGCAKDGGFEVVSKHPRLLRDLTHLTRGLGFSTSKAVVPQGWRMRIIGPELHTIPSVLPLKPFPAPADEGDLLCSGFTIEKLPGHDA